MNILITGHSGFLGSHTAKYFMEQGHVVYGVSRSLKSNCSYYQYIMDITDYDSLARLTNEKCIDVIVHIAGKPIVADCDKDPFNAYKINGLGAAAIIEAGRYANVKKIVLVETDKVYGSQEEVPTKEDAILNPGSPYEYSKAMAARFCDFYREYYDMNIVSVRPVNIFGPGDYSYTRIIPNSMRYIFEGNGIPVQEHAINIYRDFIYINDVVMMLYILATKDTKHSVYNLSTNEPISISDLAKKITKILKHKTKPIIIPKPGTYVDIPYQAIDGSRFVNEFKFKFTPFKKAILETYKDYNEKFNLPILGR